MLIEGGEEFIGYFILGMSGSAIGVALGRTI